MRCCFVTLSGTLHLTSRRDINFVNYNSIQLRGYDKIDEAEGRAKVKSNLSKEIVYQLCII